MKRRINILLSILLSIGILLYLFINEFEIITFIGFIVGFIAVVILQILNQKKLRRINEVKFNIFISIIFTLLTFFISLLNSNVILSACKGIFVLGMCTYIMSEYELGKSIEVSILLLLVGIVSMTVDTAYLIALLGVVIFIIGMIDKNSPYRIKNKLILSVVGLLMGLSFTINEISIINYIIVLLLLGRKIGIKTGIKCSIYGFVFFLLTALIVNDIDFLSKKVFDNSLVIGICSSIILFSNIVSSNREDGKMLTVFQLFLVFNLILAFIFKLDFTSIIIIYPFIIFVCSIEYMPRIINRKTNIYKFVPHKKNFENMKKVTVVIPNYNYERYIEERIDSVLNQTYPIDELIVLDDVSKDNSVEIINNKLKEVNEKYPSLKTSFIPNKKNSGNVFKQWAKCFEVSNNDYLWICEADDSANPYFLENVMKGFENNKVVISYCESLTMDENNKILMDDLRPWIDIYYTHLWDKSFIMNGKKFNSEYLCVNNTIANVSSVVFKKKKEIPFLDYLKTAEEFKLAGDWYFYEKVLGHGDISYCDKSLNYHRMHSNSVTLTTKREKEFEEIRRIQKDIIDNYKLSKEALTKIEERSMKFQHDYYFSEEELELARMDASEVIKKSKVKDKILLSIIIPVYGTEQYIEKCLNSVIKSVNNFKDRVEIIVINDGTKDNSEEIILKFKNKYKDLINYYKKENGGLSDTKNYGLERAKGRYIGFIDSDDSIKETMFDTMLKKALLEDLDLVYCDVLVTYEDGTAVYNYSTNYERKDTLMSCLDTSLMPASWSKIVKKELFKGLTYPYKLNNEDIAVSPILFARSKKIGKINTPFYYYLQRSGSIQNSGFSEKRFVAFKTAKICFDRAKEFDKATQEKIKGSIYTHQLLALLFYIIKYEKNIFKRHMYIKQFSEYMNEFSDAENNKYVKEYLETLNRRKMLELLKKGNVLMIDIYLQIGI